MVAHRYLGSRWITLEDVYALKKAGAGLPKLSRPRNEELIDWFEEKISLACSSLACSHGAGAA